MTPSAAAPVARWKVLWALLAVYLIWGSTYLAIRVMLQGLPPMLSAGARHSLAGGLLMAFALWRGEKAPTAVQWRNAAVMGFLLQACGNGGVMLAQRTVSSSLASILVSIMPLWAALFSGLLGTWPSRREWMALVLGAAGVLLLGVKGELAGQPWAVGLLLFSSAAWALGSVLGRRMDMPPGMAASAAQMLCGGVWVLGIAFFRDEALPTWPLPVAPVLAWLYLAIMGSLVGYSAFVFLLRNVRPAIATSYAYVNPVVATLLGVTLAGEHLDAWSAAGSALVLSGVVLLLWRRT